IYLLVTLQKKNRNRLQHKQQVFIGYLPAAKLDCFTPNVHSLAGYQLFHHLLFLLVDPIIAAGQNDVEMVCVNLLIHQVYPILGAYVTK
ncbi:hypothetical protein DFH29DRAFT_796841, partial [Suillus ampliporus]